MTLSDDAARNRDNWDKYSDSYQRTHGPQLNRKEFVWGVWSIPESRLNILGNVKGKRILELGCGAAQLSIALRYLGAEPTGIDNSLQQLEHAKALLSAHGFDFPLHHCAAESLPFPNETFDIVFCDHGAMSFSPTEATIKEVQRVLRRRGLFAFNIESPFRAVCEDWSEDRVEDRLVNNYFNLARSEDREDGTVYFQNPYGTWIRQFVQHGFRVIDLIELCPPAGATTTYDYVGHDWARQWPAENIWKAIKE